MEALEEDFRKEVDSLKTILAETDNHLVALREEQATFDEAFGDLERMRTNFERNIVSIDRLTDEQLRLVLTQERQLSVVSQIALAKRGKEEARRALEASVDQRQVRILGELQEATVQSEISEPA